MGEECQKLFNESCYGVESECCKEKKISDLFSAMTKELGVICDLNSDAGKEVMTALRIAYNTSRTAIVSSTECATDEACTEEKAVEEGQAEATA